MITKIIFKSFKHLKLIISEYYFHISVARVRGIVEIVLSVIQTYGTSNILYTLSFIIDNISTRYICVKFLFTRHNNMLI